MKVNRSIKIIYAIAIVLAVFLLLFSEVTETPDSATYISAWDVFSKGEIDELRTPVYPIYLGMMKTIFGLSYFKLAAVVGQYIVFLFSVAVFYKVAQKFISSESICFWITLFYAVCPGFVGWNFCILTETFAICGIVFLLYSLLRLHREFSLLWFFYITLLLAFLLLLRPAFIYLIPILFIAWAFTAIKNEKRRQAIAGMISVVIASLIMIIYMFAFQQRYGIFASSRVSTINRWHIARQYGLINPDVIADSSLRADIQESFRLYGERFDGAIEESFKKELQDEKQFFFKKYDLKTLNDALNASFLSHPLKDLSKVGGRAYRASSKPVFTTCAQNLGSYLGTIMDMININMCIIYFFLFVYSFILLRWLYIRKQQPWFSITIYVLSLCNLLLIIIGAQEEWNRLFMPSLPIIVLLFGQLCTLIETKKVEQMTMV